MREARLCATSTTPTCRRKPYEYEYLCARKPRPHLEASPGAASGSRARAQAEERGLRVGDCVLHAELLRPSHAFSGGRPENASRIRLLVARPFGGGRYIDAIGSRPTSLMLQPPAAPHVQPEAVQCASTNGRSSHIQPATAALPPVEEPPTDEDEPSAAAATQVTSSGRSPPLRNYYLEARHRVAAHRQAHVFDVLVARASSAEPLGLLIAAYSFVDVRSGGASSGGLSRCRDDTAAAVDRHVIH